MPAQIHTTVSSQHQDESPDGVRGLAACWSGTRSAYGARLRLGGRASSAQATARSPSFVLTLFGTLQRLRSAFRPLCIRRTGATR